MPQLAIAKNGVSLKTILPEAKFVGADDIWVRSCCGKWDDCQSGDVFIAIVDAESDGHLDVDKAVAGGADAIVGERLVSTQRPQCIVNDTRQAYAKICQALAGSPTKHLHGIGVTGSHGKTSVSYLIDSILSAAGRRVGRYNSIEMSAAGRPVHSSNHSQKPTWTPPQIAFTLARFVLEGCSHAVIEAPSEHLASYNFSGVDLDVAIITNVRRQHLDLHASLENYRRVKKRLLGQLKPKGIAVLNADDPICAQILEETSVPTLSFGIHQTANVQANLVEATWGEQTFSISAGSETAIVRTSIVGKPHIYNCLAAATAALALGIDLATIARGLENCHRIPGRMQVLNCGQSFKVMVDAAENSEQLASILATAKHLCHGRIFCVCSFDETQSSETRYHLGRIAERNSHQAIITGPGRAGEIDYEPTHQILDGFKNTAAAQIIPDRIRAIEWALGQAGPDDCVVVTGRGEKCIASLDDSRWQVSDAEVCQAWLYENAEPVEIQMSGPSVYNIRDYRN